MFFKKVSNEDKALQAEKVILKYTNLPFEFIGDTDTSNGDVKKEESRYTVRHVEIGSGELINTLIIKAKTSDPAATNASESTVKPEPKNLVIGHGYGNGLGFYFKNLEELSTIENTNIYAIDWLGMGRSSRPEFVLHKLPSDESVEKIEEYFVTMLEKWRVKMGLEKFVLLGHSFGGYMASLYALRYPERLDMLILESPVGIPRTPPYVDEYIKTGKIPKPDIDEESFISGKMSPDKQEGKKENVDQSTKPSFYEGMDEYERLRYYKFSELANKHTILIPMVSRLWNMNYSPQWLIRKMGGYLGIKMLNRYVSKFKSLSDAERSDLAEYMHSISVLPGSTEYSICILLKVGAYARKPLADRIHQLEVPTVFMYGETDWMDKKGGIEVIERMNVPTELVTIPKAGHNMHLDNCVEFNRVIKRVVEVGISAEQSKLGERSNSVESA